MKLRDSLLGFLILVYSISFASANSVHGCGGFVEVNINTLFYLFFLLLFFSVSRSEFVDLSCDETVIFVLLNIHFVIAAI